MGYPVYGGFIIMSKHQIIFTVDTLMEFLKLVELLQKATNTTQRQAIESLFKVDGVRDGFKARLR